MIKIGRKKSCQLNLFMERIKMPGPMDISRRSFSSSLPDLSKKEHSIDPVVLNKKSNSTDTINVAYYLALSDLPLFNQERSGSSRRRFNLEYLCKKNAGVHQSQFEAPFVPNENKYVEPQNPLGRPWLTRKNADASLVPENENENNLNASVATRQRQAGTSVSSHRKYSLEEIADFLFVGGWIQGLPASQLCSRNAGAYSPLRSIDNILPIGGGRYLSRMMIYSGQITDLSIPPGKKGVLCSTNSGDHFFGNEYDTMSGVIRAAGAGLQWEIYNRYGANKLFDVSKYGLDYYGHTEGRGYAIGAGSYDMAKTHGTDGVVVMVVPRRSIEGVSNMYREALRLATDKDYIVIPMVGAMHEVLNEKPGFSAEIAMNAVHEFFQENPDSRLKVVFAIPPDMNREAALYLKMARQVLGNS